MKPKLRDFKTFQRNLDFSIPDDFIDAHRITSDSVIACFSRLQEIPLAKIGIILTRLYF